MSDTGMTGPWVAVADALADGGRQVAVWWRDDDIVRDGPGLAAVERLATRHAVAPLMAAIPARAEASLAALPQRVAGLRFAVHGLSHRNHAPPGGKKAELGGDRPVEAVLDDLRAGHAHLKGLVGPALLPVVVPPWNRIAPQVADALPGAGLTGLSAYRGKPDHAVAGLTRRDTHIDVVDWRAGRRVKPLDMLADEVMGEVKALLARAGDDGPLRLGILTHHLDHDAADWAVIDALFALFAAAPNVRFEQPGEVFA